jgi:hypothetical protein
MTIEPFIVKHYSSDKRPSIKGNGFDGLEIGEDRAEAEEFVSWLNARLATPPAAPDWRALCAELLSIIEHHCSSRIYDIPYNANVCRRARVALYPEDFRAELATPPAAPDTTREQVKAAVADALGGSAYDCLRVWSAWGVGTMGQDDFSPIAEDDDRVAEIADAAIAALATPPALDDDERLRLVTAGICSGYIAGHEATVEGHYGDPEEVAADMAPVVLAEVGATPPAATRETGPLPQAPPTEEDIESLAEALNGDPVPAIRRALELWGGAAVSAAVDRAIPAAVLEERFERWWYYEGSVPPSEGRDWEEHVHHMTRIAWHNGAFVAAGPAAEEAGQ